jgi:hypothetical protein
MNCRHCNKPATKQTRVEYDIGLLVKDDIMPLKKGSFVNLCDNCLEDAQSPVPPTWIVILEPVELI